MDKTKDNAGTELAKEQTYCIDYNAEDIFDRGANYIDELASRNFFLDAICNYIKNASTDFNGDVENTDDILLFIKCAYEEAGIKGDRKKGPFSYNPSSLKEWLAGKRLPSKAETQRIAICLGMDIIEATEFIFKGSLVKPFNFKDIQDSVYYFCLNTGATFAQAQQIIEEIKDSNIVPEKYPENDTIKIGENVQTIQTKDELIKYLATNKKGFENQDQTALNMLRELIKKSVDLARWEREEAKALFGDTGAQAIESEEDVPAILNLILGYQARATTTIVENKDGTAVEKSIEVYKKKISESNFPDLVKNNFPQPQQLQDILNGKKTSTEAIRKAIILFTFYNIFAKLKKEKKTDLAVGFDTYSDTVDEILYKCGYVQMYWKHPYDWMFGYCAGAPDPLSELRALIEAFYLDLEDIYTTENQFDKE